MSLLQRRIEQLEARTPVPPGPDPIIEVQLICGHGKHTGSIFIGGPRNETTLEVCERCMAGEPGSGGPRVKQAA